MSDIRCVVCGEPWDSYGVTHGDMLQWEAKLFRAGAGCPACKGEPNGWIPETISHVENGDEDPMSRILAAERVANGNAPKWERPEDPKHWECDGCGVQVRTDLDDGSLVYHCPFGSVAYYNEYEFEKHGTPEKTPAHTFEGGFKVCELCLTSCDTCGEALSYRIEGDCCADGYVWRVSNDDTHAYCADCIFEAEREEAQIVWRDCYSTAQRIAYMRDHWYQFELCHTKWHPEDAWRNMLACARGKVFYGYVSELLG